MFIKNIGCIGNEGLNIHLDKIVCLVGRNNSGKSTVLHAYELAKRTRPFDPTRDRCRLTTSEDDPSEIIMDVHIPQGIGNVDEKWKISTNDLLIVRSRWQWKAPEFEYSRSTWDPISSDWASGEKASGADAVFNSRLPRPLRIGSLEDADETERMLLTLAMTPLLTDLEAIRKNPDSDYGKAVSALLSIVDGAAKTHQMHFNDIGEKVAEGLKGIFPGLSVRLQISTAAPALKVDGWLKDGSGLRVSERGIETPLAQQGTGARRTLFWAMLQVHNALKRQAENRELARKRIATELAQEKKKKPESNQSHAVIMALTAKLAALDDGSPLPESPDDPALPGYLLLIDEPENALHPMAARAAQRHLYKLAADPDWQIMLTTHSPYFINPLADHTTIIRLERSADGLQGHVTPRTYQSDLVGFDGPLKTRLQALQQLDVSLAEIFFGSYPILVEGDTEHAAFLAAVLEKESALAERITIVRARGKGVLRALIRILIQFKIDFGVLHDADSPFRADGLRNAMWTENARIHQQIEVARAAGLTVRHRCSVPDFERFLGEAALGKDKPLAAYSMISDRPDLQEKVRKLLGELVDGKDYCPMACDEGCGGEFMKKLHEHVLDWAKMKGDDASLQFAGLQENAV